MNNFNRETQVKQRNNLNAYKEINKDKNHNLVTLVLSFLLFAFTFSNWFLIGIINIVEYKVFLAFNFLLFIFSIFKLFRTIILIYKFNIMRKVVSFERSRIYVYENWHKKFVGNYWMFFLFVFLWIYFLIFIISFHFSSLGTDGAKWDVFIIVYVVLFLVVTILWYFNYQILKKWILETKQILSFNGVNTETFEYITKNIKTDYKYFAFLIVGILTFIPLFFLMSKNFRIFISKI